MAVATVVAMAAVIRRVAAVMVAVTTSIAVGIVAVITRFVAGIGERISAARISAADGMRRERRASEVPLSPAAT
jgi:hypothetical protein